MESFDPNTLEFELLFHSWQKLRCSNNIWKLFLLFLSRPFGFEIVFAIRSVTVCKWLTQSCCNFFPNLWNEGTGILNVIAGISKRMCQVLAHCLLCSNGLNNCFPLLLSLKGVGKFTKWMSCRTHLSQELTTSDLLYAVIKLPLSK